MTWEGYYSPLVIAFYDIKFTFAKKKKINQVQVTIPTCLSFVECSTFFFLVPRVHCPFFFNIHFIPMDTLAIGRPYVSTFNFSSKKQKRLWIWYKSAVGFDFWDVWGRRQVGRVAGWSVHHSMRICVVEVGAWFCSAGPLITLHCMSPIVIVTNFFIMFCVQKWVLPEYGSLGKSLYEMKPSKVDCGRKICVYLITC